MTSSGQTKTQLIMSVLTSGLISDMDNHIGRLRVIKDCLASECGGLSKRIFM